MSTFDLYFSAMDPCFLGCLLDAAQLSVNRTRRIGPRTVVPFREIDTDSGGSASLWYATQVSHTFHCSYCTFVTTLFSAFCSVVPQPSSAGMSTLRRIFRFWPKNDIREDANSHKVIQCKYLSRSFCTTVSWDFPDWLLPLRLLFSRRTSTSWCWWLRGWSYFRCRFCTIVTLVPETALVSPRTLTFLLSTDSKFLFLSQCHFIPCDS